MREIKFRAWQEHSSLHRKSGMYVVNDMIWYDKPHDGKTGEVFFVGHTSSEYIEDIELMQFTGLLDKNGKEIYEGDIVSSIVQNKFRPPYTFIVKWLSDLGRFILEPSDGAAWYGLENSGEIPHGNDHLEVIGNIYENPDLKESESRL